MVVGKKGLVMIMIVTTVLTSGCERSSSTIDELGINTSVVQQTGYNKQENELLEIAYSYQDIYEQSLNNNTIDTIETQEQIINCIGKMGYAVVDVANQIDMLNYNQMMKFINNVSQKKTSKMTLVCVGLDGDFVYYDFETSGGSVDVTEKHVVWDGKNPEISATTEYEAYTWKYTDEGYLLFEQYHMSGYDGSSGHRAIRIQPLNKNFRQFNLKYILPVSYKWNNLFIVDWNEDDYGNLDFYDLFDLFYPKVYGKAVPYTADDDLGVGAIYHIPKEEFENTIMLYMAIDSNTLQKKSRFEVADQTYEYRPRGLYDCEPPSYPFPEVENYIMNGDGTITLTINAVYPDHNTAKAFAHEVTIRPLENGSFQYVSNHILPDEDNDIGSWRVNRLNEDEWNDIYGKSK